MSRRNNLTLLSFFKSASFVMSILIICIGMLVLSGWLFNITLFKSISPNYVSMNSEYAIIFILIGIALLLQQTHFTKQSSIYLIIGKWIAIIIFGLLITITTHSITIVILNFFLVSIALFLVKMKNTLYINQTINTFIGLIGLFILTTYLFNPDIHAGSASLTTASVYSGICFILISLSLFFLQPSSGVMSLFISNTSGGSVARRLIPVVIAAPILFGYLQIIGEQHNFYSASTGMEFYYISITLTFIIVTLLISFMLMHTDILQLKIERELRTSEERFHKAMDTAPIGMAIVALDGKFIEVNKALCELVGYSKDELTHITFQQITHSDDLAIDVANSRKLIEGKIHLNQIEKRYIRKNGDVIWVQLTASLLRDSVSHHPLYFITQVQDITERKLTEERIRHLAYHDSLTNLPNRRLLLDRLSIAFDFAKRYQLTLALMFLDLDKFKSINDSLGHDVGDELLKAAAVRLNHALRSVDTIARISGDEFVILLNGLQNADEAGHIAQKIIENMSQHFLIHGHEIYIGCTIGISIYPNDGVEISELMKKADLAMYAGKEAGRNQYQYFTPR